MRTPAGPGDAAYIDRVGSDYIAVDAIGRRIGRFASRLGAHRALRTVRLRTRAQRPAR